MIRTVLLVSGVVSLLSGCVAGPDYKKPETDLPGKFSESPAKPAKSVELVPWWEGFRDKRLNELVRNGMDDNLSVQAALERVVEAQAAVVVAGAGALPQVTASKSASIDGRSGSYLRQRSGMNSTTTKSVVTGVNSSWLLDLFGQYRRSREAANASLDAAFDDVNVARLAYVSDLSSAYADMRYYQEALAQTRRNLASRRETLKLINDRREAGAVSRLDLAQAEGLVNQTLSEIPNLETGFHVAANRVATLLGVPAASLTKEFMKGSAQPVPRYRVKTGVPADLLRNRPDIRRAERLLAAETARIGVAEAQLYPSVTLNGTVDAARISTRSVTGNLLSWSFGPSVSLPILDGGARKAGVDIAKSAAAQRYIEWKQAVLNAVEEVENAQIALNRDYETAAAIRKLIASSEEALSLARESYLSGESTVLDVLDAERNVAAGRLSLAAAIRDLAIHYIELNVAIGGGSAIGA